MGSGGNTAAGLIYRDKNRLNWAGNTVATEHTAYTNGEKIAEYIESQNIDDRRSYNSTFFDFVNYRDPAVIPAGNFVEGDNNAERVTIRHSQSYRTQFDYDASLGQYKMAQYYSSLGSYRDTIDENNDQQLMFDNVIVLFTDIHTYPATKPRICSMPSTAGAALVTTATAARSRRSAGRRVPRWTLCVW